MNITPEHCWILLGERRNALLLARKVQMTTGSPTDVEFNADWVIEQEENPEHEHESVVGFLHTHPSGKLLPSKRDVATMQAWTSCLGKPLYCLIACEQDLATYRFDNDESHGTKIESCGVFSGQWIVVHDHEHEHDHVLSHENEES